MLYGQLFSGGSDLVGGIRLEPAMMDIDGLIESAGFMEAQDILFIRDFAIDFFFGQPSAIGEREFEFIAVINIWVGAKDGLKIQDIQFADTEKRIFYELLFVRELSAVIQVLPATAAAHLKVFAEGLYSLWRGADKFMYDTLEEAFLFSDGEYLNEITRNGIFHKEDPPFRVTANTAAFFSDTRDADLISNKLFSCHN
jgi:hypothetical protein